MTSSEPIAIVGTACRFAGDTDSPSKLWELLREPYDVRKEIPADRFNVDGWYHVDGAYHGHSNVKHAYVMNNDPAVFDTEFFGIKPSEAKSMDPQQRILLEVVYESIESAGMTIQNLSGSDTAVYAGLMTNDYGMLLTRDLAHVPTYHATGISAAIVSNRISYFFDWHGPSMTIDTGCSASLVALHLAVQSLRSGESSMALACGTNLILGPEYFVIESKLKMLSKDGRSKMWDQEANGYARGDGVTAIVLKTLSAAIADGDHVECIIRETGLNQDGSTPGLTMPSAVAQGALIRSTYAKAGLDLGRLEDRPQYFEAHGTGTPAGDPIEAEAISKAFFSDEVKKEMGLSKSKAAPLCVGSIKTVLGHTEGSAGLAAILKASLALQNATIPPNMLFNNLSNSVAPFYGNLEIAREAKPWPALSHGQVRRASVNSFGFGGANAHAILESYTPPHSMQTNAVTLGAGMPLFTPFVFSASSDKVLKELLSAYATYLAKKPEIDLRDLAFTLRERRPLLPYRVAFASTSVEELAIQIQSQAEQGSSGIKTLARPDKTHHLLGIFTGQGAQYARMGAELVEQSPMARSIIKDLEELLSDLPANDRPVWSLYEELLATSEVSRVHEASISQPLCTAVQIMMVDLLSSANVRFNAVVGHSSGEIAAAYAAGFLSAREAIYIAYYRGVHLKLARSPNGKAITGAMLAVGSSMQHMTQVCESSRFAGRISVAACNSSSSITMSGDDDAIVELEAMLNDERVFNRRLRVDRAYHSSHMTPCGDPYVTSLDLCVRDRQVQDPAKSCRWFSSVYDRIIDSSIGVTTSYWAENMTNTVLFAQALASASSCINFEVALEVGAHPALKGPAKQIIGEILPSDKSIAYYGTLDRNTSAINAFSSSLGQLWCLLGSPQISLADFEKRMSVETSDKRKVVKGLPSNPWEHGVQFWHEARASRQLRLRRAPVHPLLGDMTPDSSAHHLSWRNLLRIKEIEWLSGHAIQGQIVFPAAGYMCSALEACRHAASGKEIQLIELLDFKVYHAVVFPEDDAGVEVLIEIANISTPVTGFLEAKFSYSAALGDNVETLTLVASSSVCIRLAIPSITTLPASVIGLSLPHASEVDGQSFYSCLADLGYDFNDRFCSLRNLTRRHGKSSSTIQTQTAAAQSDPMLIHPAELDASFQAILLACSYPGDEQLRVLHLPTELDIIRVNPMLCCSGDLSKPGLIPVEGAIRQRHPGELGIVGDVNIYPSTSPNAMIQIQGAKLLPLGGEASKKDDRIMFSGTKWIKCSLNGNDFIPPSQHQYDAMAAMERISAFYLRQFTSILVPDQSARFEPPTSLYMDHANRITRLVDTGEHALSTHEWVDDTLETITNLSRDFSDIPDVRLMHLVGEFMPQVLHGRASMVDEFRKAQILGKYYINGTVIQSSASWIIGMLKQIAARFPNTSMLEIGAGSGEGVTSRFPEAIDEQYLNYTYANISGSIQADGSAFFAQPGDPKPARIFDFELEPSSQGYSEESYDIVIAFWILHATRDMDAALAKLRRLLKPGGYLIVAEGSHTSSGSDGGLTYIFGTLEGWWLGMNSGRTLSPYLSLTQWDDALKSTGFSGVDVTPPKEQMSSFGATLFLSQAVDDAITFLRNPIDALSSTISPVQDVVVVGGTTLANPRFIHSIETILVKAGIKVSHFTTLQDVDYSVITRRSVTLSLTELDEPVFFKLTEPKFAALKRMFERATTLVWVTSGRLDQEPYCNLTLGFGRTAQIERPDLVLQQVEITDPLTFDPRILVRTILRLAFGAPKNTLWSTEPEIIVDQTGTELIPRLKPIPLLNDRHNSVGRKIKHMINIDEFTVGLMLSGRGYTSRERTSSFVPQHALLDLRTIFSGSIAIRTTAGHKFLVMCGDKLSENTYLSLVSELASGYQLPATDVVHYSGTIPDLAMVAAQLISTALLQFAPASSTVVIHNATRELQITLAAEALALDMDTVFTSDSECDAAVGHRIPRYSSRHELATLIPESTALFVGFSTSDAQSRANEEAMISSLPSHCHFERSDSIYAHTGLSRDAQAGPALRNAVNKLASLNMRPERTDPPVKSVDVGSILTRSSISNKFEILDWTICRILPVAIDNICNQIKFTADKTYWLLGLSAALGSSLFDFMIRRGAKNLAFSSRNPKLDQTWLASHRRSGVKIKVVACDVCDEVSVRKAHGIICSGLPPIGGVLNGAAVFRDILISNMSLKDLDETLRPKVLGSLNLDRLFRDQNLEFFILTSSITGLLGSPGQANYTAANTFMCGLAAQRRKRGLSATAINLGAIAGIGLLERSDKKVLESIMQRLSLMPVSESDFHQIFAEAIEAGRPDSTNCGPELTTALQAIPLDGADPPAFASNPQFSHFRCSSDQQEMKESRAMSIKDSLAQCESGTDLESVIKRAFSHQLRKVLQTSKDDDELMQMHGIDLGIDSLVSIDLRTWFNKALKVNMPVLKIMANDPLGCLIPFLADHLPAEIVPNMFDLVNTVMPSIPA